MYTCMDPGVSEGQDELGMCVCILLQAVVKLCAGTRRMED